ncbi:MAG TPA: helix-turn-helix domain-containing protein [Steroidobacteraceae bacterium]|jgi:AraC-like DNA-binding protein|nr:helix-turn-helix domain-containing protein [Steroidobacteraceae bacterium]
MPQLETFSTAELPPHRRLEYWNDLTGSAFTPLVTEPVDKRAFVGRLTRTRVGDIRLAEARSEPAIVRHSRQHVARTRDALFMLCLQLDGVSVNRQQGREAVLRYGDFHLLDSSRPYEVSFQQPNRMLVLSVPHPELARRMPNPESLVGIAMSGRSGVSGLLSSLLCNFWQQRRTGDETFLSPRFSEAILDLVASAYASITAAAPEGSSIAIARREQIRSYIETHLHDPALTPGSVAAAVHLSPRRLHQLFEADGETVGAYILRRRLEECARAMSDASQRSRTVTEIAFLHGFNNASHFGRVFRERYQSTPSDYRRRSTAA